MILISLGTQDKSFRRLLETVEDICEREILKERIIVQAGYTKFISKHMEILDYIPQQEFDKLIGEADLVIAHGGVGTIMTALMQGKKVIGVPRLAKYGEHHNDHQIEVLEQFDEKGYLIYARGVELLEDALFLAKGFQPQPYQSDRGKVLDLIRNFIKQS